MKKSNNDIKIITASTVVIASLFILSAYLFQTFDANIKSAIGANSVGGMLIYVLIFIISVVLTPISSVPLIPIGTGLWGIMITTILSTVGWTIGAMVAFFLAREYGRPYVGKLIGIDKIESIEKLIPKKNIFLTIFFFRAVTPFDGLSYVLGLMTRVSPKIFFWSTFLGLIPFCFIMSYLGTLPMIFLISGLALACLFFIIGVYKIKTK